MSCAAIGLRDVTRAEGPVVVFDVVDPADDVPEDLLVRPACGGHDNFRRGRRRHERVCGPFWLNTKVSAGLAVDHHGAHDLALERVTGNMRRAEIYALQQVVPKAWLAFPRVNDCMADSAAVECGQQCIGVDDGPARGIQEDTPILHTSEEASVGHVMRGIGSIPSQWDVHGDDVCLLQEQVERDKRSAFGAFAWRIACQHGHAERLGFCDHPAADVANANHSNGLSRNCQVVAFS